MHLIGFHFIYVLNCVLFVFKSCVTLEKISFVVTSSFARGYLIFLLFLLIYSLNNSSLVAFFFLTWKNFCAFHYLCCLLQMHFAVIVSFLSRGNQSQTSQYYLCFQKVRFLCNIWLEINTY